MVKKKVAAKPLDERPPGLYRSKEDVVLGGVCGGIAEKLEIQSWVVRVGWVLISLAYGVGIILYILLWIFLPIKE